jgi:predicted RNase H-like HicB family nuclease
MTRNYTAVIQKSEGWWIGWIQEVNGVNCQERTREELLVSLKSGLEDILELNQEEAIRRTEGESFEKVTIAV